MNRRTTLLGALAVTLVAPIAASAAPVIQTGQTSAGTVLTDAHNMTLYVFDKDSAAVSNCNGGCAKKWPPLKASRSARPKDKFGIIIRADGSRQWAYKGQPLYTWFKDQAAGDTTGNGVKGVWHLARP